MTLAQLAFALLVVLILGSFAIALDWAGLLVTADSAAVETARFFLPVWEYLERGFLR